MSLLWITAGKTYYHASAHDLPVGTVLKPQRDEPSMPGKPHGVFLSRDLDTAHDWAHLLGNHHVYEVTAPETQRRRQKDALGDYEWIAPHATITRKVGEIEPSMDYCDGCL